MKNFQINQSVEFPFKEVKSQRGVKYKQRKKNSEGEGTELVIEHNGHDHLTIEFRRLTRLDSGRIGNNRLLFWNFNTVETVQLASLLLYLADEHMRDFDESPHISVVASKDKVDFGPNWVLEDFNNAVDRTDKRKARSYLFGLLKRCIETCDDEAFIQSLLMNVGLWAEGSGDEFACQQAEKAFFQLGMVP